MEETFSLKCLEEVWEEGHKDPRKENQSSMLLNAHLKKSIMVRAQKLQLIEIEFAQNVMEREEKTELTQLALDAKEEESKLK